MRLRAWRFVSLVLAALGAAACTRNPYVIGSICPAAGVDAGAADPRCGTTPPLSMATLSVGLDQSGAMALGPLAVAGGSIEPTLRLRGERATATAWPTDGAASLGRGAGAPLVDLGAPFKDGTGAVGLAADAPTYVAPDGMLGAVGLDDFALEIVLRATPGTSVISKQAGGIGWSLRTIASGVIELDLGDGDATHAAAIGSKLPGLTAGAWYHCVFWVSRAAGGRADCDGSPGQLTTPFPALRTLDAPLAILAAGGGAAPIPVAHVALFRVAAGGLGDPSGWLAESARRFAMLAGAYPQFAKGTALPAAGLRGSVAYVDLQDAPGTPRRLFLVGEDWPRIACRSDVDGMYACGYLSEPRRVRGAPADAAAWQPTAVTVAASTTPFPDGEPRFSALTPSNALTVHTLSVGAIAGSQNQVFSFFVHRLTAARVGASAGTFGTAVFDLAMGAATPPSPIVTATIEAWGPGVWRCSYAVGGAVGPQTYTVQLLDDAGNATFAGAGGPTIEIGGLQVDDGLGFAGSLLAVDPQAADHLTFVADDGNLPSGTSGKVNLSVLLPAGNRVNDQAILNLNRGGSYDDQVQLYVVGPSNDAGNVKFWRLENRDTYWSFDGALPVTDGRIHVMQASWDVASAHLVISNMPKEMAAQMPNTLPLSLDRIDVGFSQASSGALEGLVAGLQIGAM